MRAQSESEVEVTGRFAPTPSADLHVGNLRTALVSWLAARAAGEPWLIRIEDLDVGRLPDADAIAQRQVADLALLGLTSDQPIVRQSERYELYAAALARLETYECFCSRRDVATAAQAPHGSTPRYPGTCRDLTDDQRDARRGQRPPCLRVRAHGATATIHDVGAGDVTAPVDDFVVRRADGTYAYHLAVVVDDAQQGVTQVVRADDLLDAAPRQAWLATQLGLSAPTYCHVPLVVLPDGTRLAKRERSAGLGALLARGFTPTDVIAALATSLNLADAGEPVTLDDLVARFDPARLPRDPWLTDPSTWVSGLRAVQNVDDVHHRRALGNLD